MLLPFALSLVLPWTAGPINSVVPLRCDDKAPFGHKMFNHVPEHQLALKHTSHFPPKWVSCRPCDLPGAEAREVVVKRGEGEEGDPGQEQQEEGWANRQTLKVTIPISHQISRTPVITAYSWEVPMPAQISLLTDLVIARTEMLGSSYWKVDYRMKERKTRKRHSLITMLPQCSLP